jgi:Bacteriophage baseplate protein W
MAGSDFLGRGWAFELGGAPGVGPGPDGRIAEAGADDKVRQSIWLILATAPGERVTRPDFGCGIHDLVFAPRTAGTLGEIIRAVTEALTRWEPRIELLSVDARPHPDDALGVLVEVSYEVRATNSRFNFVYPFYLSA